MKPPVKRLTLFLLTLWPFQSNAFDGAGDVPSGNWYGDDVYVGYAYDLHANEADTEVGANLSIDYLVEQILRMNVDLLQTDSKGHEGLVSWKSKTPAASIAPGIVQEVIPVWTAAGKELGIPVQAHYSGIFDEAAGAKFPNWNAIDADGNPVEGKMCPRGPYVDELLIPQAKELIHRYGISGIWVDGEIWAVTPCYCDVCSAAFVNEYGIQPPRSQESSEWTKWIAFTRRSFEEYVAHYTEEIHGFNPDTRVCSNWLYSFRNPGRPWVSTDFLSGDNLGTLAHPNTICNARFLSTRKRHWEVMVWGFYYNEQSPWITKPLDLLKQHVASTVALGGSVNIYNQPKGHRDSRMPEWQVRQIGELADFVKARKAVSDGSETRPNAVVLHSEHDFYAQTSPNIWEYETRHLEGAVYGLLHNGISTDLMDEWALLGQINRFPLVVAPSQEAMSDEAVGRLKKYVREGGHLLLTGPEVFDRFGASFLGVEDRGIEEYHTFHLPAGAVRFPLSSEGHQGSAWTEVPVYPWRQVVPTSAKGFGSATTTLMEEDGTLYFGATIRQVGKGKVAYIPVDLMTYYYRSRYVPVREFIGEVIDAMDISELVEVDAPSAVEPIFRSKEGTDYLHLVNHASGLPVFENERGGDEVPPVGPVTLRIALSERPQSVRLLFEPGGMSWHFEQSPDGDGGLLTATVPLVFLHSAIEIKKQNSE